MLPPVRTTFSSGNSYQSQPLFSVSAHLHPQTAQHEQLPGRDHNNASTAGKLNILLMSGRESVAEDLSLLAEALGKTIGLTRREGESDFDFTTRLAAALRTLTPDQRAEVQKQITQLFEGLKLRLVIQALSDPAGPEATRVVTLMEIARNKDRDPATRPVLDSYHQNSAEDLPFLDAAEGPAPTAATARAFDAQPAARSATQTMAADTASASSAKTTKTTLDAASPDEADAADIAADDIRHATVTATERGRVSSTGVRTLQDILKQAFDAGESGDSVIEAKATRQMLMADTADDSAADLHSKTANPQSALPARSFEASARTRRPQMLPAMATGDHTQQTAPDMRDASATPASHVASSAERGTSARPALPQTAERFDMRPQERAAPATASAGSSPVPEDASFRPTLQVLKGWTEIPPTIPARLQAAIAAALDIPPASLTAPEPPTPLAEAQPAPPPMARPEPPSTTWQDRILPERAPSFAKAASLTADAATDMPRPPLAVPAPAARVAAEAFTPQSAVQQAVAALTVSAQTALPFATVPYPFVTDPPSEEDDEKIRHRFEDSEDEAEGDDGETAGQDEDQTQADAQTREDADNQEVEVTIEAANSDDLPDSADIAYGLYQRMGGWA